VDASSLEAFKARLDLGFGSGCGQPGLEGSVPAYNRGLDLDDLKDPFQPKPFHDSTIRKPTSETHTLTVSVHECLFRWVVEQRGIFLPDD